LARAVEHAHRHGIVHRDIKPSNVLVTTEGQLKLCDFGVAKVLTGSTHETLGGLLVGTPEYMAPEQVAGEPVDGRCDVYALGAVLYELVTGSPVFEGPSAVVVMGKQLREDPEPPRVRAPRRGIPEALDRAILRAIAKSPGDRFATATAMREALESAVAAPERSRSRTRKLAAAIAVGGSLALVAALTSARGWVSGGMSGAPAMAEAPHAVEPDLLGGVPLPVPPTAAPEPMLPPPPFADTSERPGFHAASASLPPLPGTRLAASSDGSHPADGTHPRKLHSRVPGLETVSHKTATPHR
jgi:hypothetical protein